MTRYQVDSEAVFSATSAVRATISRLEAESASLNGQLSLLQHSWTGQAAAAFQAVAADWQATELRLRESLAAISQALGHAGQTYADVEMQNARMFQPR